MRLDTLLAIETPEGMDLHLPLAGIFPRLAAWLLDTMLRYLIVVLMSLLCFLFYLFGAWLFSYEKQWSEALAGLWMIALFLIEWFYPVLSEMLLKGRSPGKRALGLLVLREDGRPLSWSASITRNLLRSSNFLFVMLTILISTKTQNNGFVGFCLVVIFILLDMIVPCLNKRFQRLGDLAAGTVVVYRQFSLARPPAHRAPAQVLPVPLCLSEQRLLMDFANQPQLSSARTQELASILHPLTEAQAQAQSLNGVAILYGYAATLFGQQKGTKDAETTSV